MKNLRIQASVGCVVNFVLLFARLLTTELLIAQSSLCRRFIILMSCCCFFCCLWGCCWWWLRDASNFLLCNQCDVEERKKRRKIVDIHMKCFVTSDADSKKINARLWDGWYFKNVNIFVLEHALVRLIQFPYFSFLLSSRRQSQIVQEQVYYSPCDFETHFHKNFLIQSATFFAR